MGSKTQEDVDSVFVDIQDVDESLYTMKSRYYALKVLLVDGRTSIKHITMIEEVHQWCKENSIKYRKVEMSKSVKNSKNKVITYIGERSQGLLFYSTEDATAFKLRWL